MAALTLRVLTRPGDTTKDAPLSNAEIDTNFINLDADIELRAPIESPTFTGTASFNSTTAVKLPVGTDAQKPTGAAGDVRFNSTNITFEGYTGTVWQNFGDVFLNSSQTLTNKTISVDDNTISGIAASSFVLSNASGNVDGAAAQKAIPSGDVVGTTDTQTLTNKTISADNNTISGIAASSFVLSNSSGNVDGAAAQKAIPSGVVVGTTDTQTLTNKTISADSNTLSGIAASSFVLSNASGNIDGAAAQKAIPSGDVVGTTDTQTLTNKTLTSPTINDGTTNLDGGTLILPQTTTPAQTAEGSVVWDTDNDVLTIGTGTARKTLVDTDSAQTLTNKTIGGSQISGNISGSAANVTGTVAVANGGTGATDAATARTNLGLAIGTNVQAYDADLTALAGLAVTDGNFIVGNGTTWVAESGATARTSLGLGTAATMTGPSGTIVGTTDTQTLTNKTISTGSTWSGNTIGLGSGGTGASLADPNADRILFWDDSAGTMTWLTPGANISITGTTIDAVGFGTGDVVTNATQTLTNKTISVDDNTISGIAASSFVLSNASGNIDGAAAAKTIPSGEVVGTSDTQTLTNKTLTNPTINAGGSTIVLPQTTAPAQTAEGSIVWDTDNDLLTIGTGAGRKTIVDTDSTQTLTNKTIGGSQISGNISGNAANVTGTVALANGGTGQALSDPNADRILFWDDSAGAVTWLATSTGLSLSGTTLTNSAPNVTTDISITHAASSVTVNSSDGADGTINAATTALAGVMTAADKTKLDGIATGAQTNQNAFSNVAVSGQTTVAADSVTDTLTLVAGNAITITTDATGDSVTIAHTDTSTQASVNNSNGTVIQDITLDGNGHITAIGSVDLDPRYLNTDGDTLTGPLTVSATGNIIYSDTGGTYIPRPQNASYKTDTNIVTGAVTIQLPTTLWANINDMLSFWVDIYDYSTNESVSIFVYGYAYGSSTGSWANAGATILTPRTDRDYNVRFGHDGTRHVVCIGEIDTVWNYPQIVVRDFQGGYTASPANLDDGWAITFLTTLPTVGITSSGNTVVAKQLQTARTISLTGDVTGSTTFDGSANVAISATIAANSVALGTDTTGNYVAGLTAGTGISISGTAGEGWSPTVTNSAPNVTTDISISHAASSVTVNSSDGADGTINAATTALAGVMTAADKTKLDGIATGATANTGTVTSVGGTGTVSGLTLSGTVTTSGNLTLGGTLAVAASNFASQTAKTFLAAPNAAAGTPTFRTIVASDIPTLNQNTTGTAANVTGTVALANGGTGASLADPNADRILFWDDSAGAVTWLSPGTGINISGTTISVATLNQNTTGTASNVTGIVALANGGTGASLADPNADRILFWDDSAGTMTWLTPGTGLSLSGSTLSSVISAANNTTSASYYPVFATSQGSSVSLATNSSFNFNPGTGVLSATDFNSTSDIKLKDNIQEIDGLQLLEKVNPVSFTWKKTGRKSYGVIAQEIENILPELVENHDDGNKGVSYIPLIALLIDAVKKLESRVLELEKL